MKNKKGFTLIELLAVIAILAIILVLTIPSVLKLFTQARENAFITQAQSIFKSAQQEYLLDQFNPEGANSVYCYVWDGTSSTVLSPLETSGSKKISYKIVMNGALITSIKVSDGENSITQEDTVNGVSISDIEQIDTPYSPVTTCN